MTYRRLLAALLAYAVGAMAIAEETLAPPPGLVAFNRDIRPILADACFQCHGPDSATRKAGLRLDEAASALASRDGSPAIVPGNVAASELVRRITTDDPLERMPPPAAQRQLSRREGQLLERWIAEGAPYEPHWSFVPPRRPELPAVPSGAESRNPIDLFVQARLANLGLGPSPEADRATLIRRLSLDLTGLPPTCAEIETFAADDDPMAYDRLVDRLLGSARYGERMAIDWLDAARYADTHGYLFDTERSMWRWRDWLIEAFNQNMPFDEFTIVQLAGDLLPQPTLEQQIASGFNRNHIINNEAGATPEEYFVENIVDRINTTATVWMGLSLACAQCHDHKYDPITQREYYQLYAFFNNVPEQGLDGFNSNAKPLLPAPTADQRERLASLARQITATQEQFAPIESQIAAAQAQWEQELPRPPAAADSGLIAHLPLDGTCVEGATHVDGGEFKEGTATYETGLLGQAASFDGQRFLELGNVADLGVCDPFSLCAWVAPATIEGRRSIFSRMEAPEANFRGYTLQLIQGKPALILVNEFPENLLQVETKTAIEPHQWHHIAAVYDGTSKAAGVQIYVDGVRQQAGVTIDTLRGSFRTEKPLQVGNGHPAAKFQGRIDEVRVYNRALSADEISRLPGLTIESLIAVAANARNEEQSRRIREYYLKNAAPADWKDAYQRLGELRNQRKEFERTLPTVMVMQEREQPRETKMLIRGAYSRPGETVTAATPAFLPPMDADLPRNRLGLARWLVGPNHPLTARVAVNRIWQTHFGAGLVRTTENFGVQGDIPVHADLLDWLAAEFIASGWNVKGLQRLIVTSATYRQSSHLTDRLREIDPDNRLLGRGPRHRLQAELVRDVALAVSGLLVERAGGKSVKPYMPAELWREVAFDVTGNALTAQIYVQDQGESLYRRSLYTFWKRTSPPPSMLIFDAPDRERCVVRRDQTNTPLQALVLMNEPLFVEASRKLAERMLTEGGAEPADRLSWGFLAATGRRPAADEVAPLANLLAKQLERFAAHPESATELLRVGESPRQEALPAQVVAAYAVVANVLLNLDETLVRD